MMMMMMEWWEGRLDFIAGSVFREEWKWDEGRWTVGKCMVHMEVLLGSGIEKGITGRGRMRDGEGE